MKIFGLTAGKKSKKGRFPLEPQKRKNPLNNV
jgi:hypothetical protein